VGRGFVLAHDIVGNGCHHFFDVSLNRAGTVLQDFRDGRRGTLLDAGSVPSPAGGGSPTLTLAPELILEAPDLRPGQLGQPPDDLLY
jgi:hypothetical protein